jgi:hypothetical protein
MDADEKNAIKHQEFQRLSASIRGSPPEALA